MNRVNSSTGSPSSIGVIRSGSHYPAHIFLNKMGRLLPTISQRHQPSPYLKKSMVSGNRRFELLGENPNFGRARDDIKIGYHCSDYNKHVVFYVIQNDCVEILAILHERMIPERHL